MSVFNIFTLLGGLAFFLFGMSTMSNGLERVAGGKLERIGTREEILPDMMSASGACKVLTEKTV